MFSHEYRAAACAITESVERTGLAPLAPSPLDQFRRLDTKLTLEAFDIGVVANTIEPLEHQRHVLTVLSDFFDGDMHEFDRPAEASAQDPCSLRHGHRVAGEIDLPTIERRGVRERSGAV